MKRIIIVCMIIITLIFIDCARVDTEADIQAQKDHIEKWDSAITAGDFESIASMYTEDAVRMDPYEPAIIGREAIRDSYKKTLEQYDLMTSTSIEDVKICGDCALLRCLTTGKLISKTTGESIQIKNKSMAFRQRQSDGTWKTVSDIWNSDHQPLGGSD